MATLNLLGCTSRRILEQRAMKPRQEWNLQVSHCWFLRQGRHHGRPPSAQQRSTTNISATRLGVDGRSPASSSATVFRLTRLLRQSLQTNGSKGYIKVLVKFGQGRLE